jgi:glycosyltransferase involved in cell wall biosynthesis
MKLLVTTDFNPNSPGGGPAIIREMLKGFRETGNEIHWWSCQPRILSAHIYQLDSLTGLPIPSILMPRKKAPKFKAYLLYYFWSHYAGQHLRYTISHLKPNCIWAIPHNWSILPIHDALVGRKIDGGFQIHTSIHDYPDVHGNKIRWGEKITYAIKAKQLEIYANADTRDAISLPMLKDLERHTNKKGVQILHDGIDWTDFKKNKKTDFAHKEKVKLAFAGTILAEKEFVLLINALKIAGANQSNISIEIWSAHSYKHKAWFDPAWMHEHIDQPKHILINLLSECDWGCIVMPLESDENSYSLYSLPAKFVSYLAASIPPLIIGRPDSAVVQLADQYNLGLRFHSTSPEKLAILLRQSIWNQSLAKGFQQNLVECSRDHFNAETMRRTLWECLKKVN